MQRLKLVVGIEAEADQMVTVIVPYYQKEPGILQRALRSVGAQQACPMPLKVIVVDDDSPIPAAEELTVLGDIGVPIECICQSNGGPGAARNTGLNHASNLTKYVAFLDSDDEWLPNHLASAIAALQSGYDFYFADHLQLDAEVSAFKRAGRIRPEEHPVLEVNPTLHAYQGDMFDQIVRGNVIGTPTVVYNLIRFGHHRFKVEFTNVGEDYLFWMDIALAGARCAFSEEIDVVCGRGVNIYAGSGWGSDKHLLRVHNEIKFKKLLCSTYPLNQVQHRMVNGSLSDLRMAFARDVLHRVRHNKGLPIKLLRAHFRLDPLSFFMFPINTFRIRKSS
jgi:succinoglycan biosynthesis protein ExoW